MNPFIALLIYVDDIIITCANTTHIQELKKTVNKKVPLKRHVRHLKFFLDLELTRNSTGLFLSHRQYIIPFASLKI